MNWIKFFQNVVTLGNSLYVFTDRCECGSNDVRINDGLLDGEKMHCVFCNDCRARTAWYKFPSTSKRAWNRMIRGER